jgi:hypothetical protein
MLASLKYLFLVGHLAITVEHLISVIYPTGLRRIRIANAIQIKNKEPESELELCTDPNLNFKIFSIHFFKKKKENFVRIHTPDPDTIRILTPKFSISIITNFRRVSQFQIPDPELKYQFSIKIFSIVYSRF